jgi:hypothetical protein
MLFYAEPCYGTYLLKWQRCVMCTLRYMSATEQRVMLLYTKPLKRRIRKLIKRLV